ncbi:hypothetical protein [Peribacillus butanolivorans]|uniref:hypothetical protein n=1 Tax=Peribacillus butanolivorans TaxID=421767 RepID=UPI00366A4C45
MIEIRYSIGARSFSRFWNLYDKKLEALGIIRQVAMRRKNMLQIANAINIQTVKDEMPGL